MATFEYQALTTQGKKVKGQKEGDSARQVRQKLREQGLTPLVVQPLAPKSHPGTTSLFQKAIPTDELALMTRQLYTLLSAGMPLAQALQAVAKQAETKRLQQFLTALYQSVSEGNSFAQALKNSPFKVSEEYQATVAAGEESGHLEQVLSRLADAIEQQEKLTKKLKAALIYPMVMVLVAVSIVFFLVIYVVPKLITVFENMHQTLPPLTQGLINLSHFMQLHWGQMIVLLIIAVIGFKLLMRHAHWRERFHALLLRLPAVRRFLIYAASARWARTLGVLLNSGVPALEALRISAEVMTLLPLKKKVEAMREQVRKGQPISRAMQEAGFFPVLLINLVETGEGNGQIDQMLLKGAERYEEDVASAAQTLLAILEPMLIVVMGGIVLTIVLAIMLPMFEMNQMVH